MRTLGVLCLSEFAHIFFQIVRYVCACRH